MKSTTVLLLVIIFGTICKLSSSIPLPGHFNAHADDFSLAAVEIEKDIVLSPGKGGNNFNAESENNASAIVTVGGAIHGFAENRTGEEFNAISRKHGTSQVRVGGDLLIENLDPSAKKFDAVSDSEGQSLVQLGNVVIVSGARRAAKSTRDTKDEQAPWGAAAVADHNSRPWETINHGIPAADEPILVPESNLSPSHDEAPPPPVIEPEVTTQQSSTVQHNGNEVAPTHIPTGTEHPIVNGPTITTSEALLTTVPATTEVSTESHPSESVPEVTTVSTTISSTSVPEVVTTSTTVPPSSAPPKLTSTTLTTIVIPEVGESHVHPSHLSGGYQFGSLNAISKGQGSKSMVQMKGFVHY